MEMVSEHFKTLRDHLRLFLGPNLKLLQTNHVTTQNDRERSRIPIELVSEVNFQTLR